MKYTLYNPFIISAFNYMIINILVSKLMVHL